MKSGILSGISLAASLAFGQQALASSPVTVNFHFAGGGISTSGTLTYDLSSADPTSGGYTLTGITGFFSDPGLGISNAAIENLVATDGSAPPAGTTVGSGASTAYYPNAMSLFSVSNPMNLTDGEGNVIASLSYDNLYYPGGSPIVCAGWTGSGTPIDTYGLLFNVAGGDVVNVFSNGYGTGVLPPGLPVFGAAVVDPDNNLQAYVGAGISAPEPSTWAMLLVGFAGLGFAGARTVRRAA